MDVAFLHPVPGVVLAVFAARASSLPGILHPGLGCAPAPTAVLPGYWSNWCAPATKPWLPAKTRKPHGAPVLAVPGSPRAAFPSLIFFVSQDLMHYSALRTLRGVGRIMVLQRARAHPADAGFSCHGLISPSSIKPGIVLTTQVVPPRR